MSNNPFNIAALEAGREWARENPKATGVQIDAAALAHSPFDPANRHFQMGACDMLNRSLTQIFYRWGVRCRTGHCSSGMAHDVKEAQEIIKDVSQLYHDQGRVVTSWSIYDKDDVCIVSMDLF